MLESATLLSLLMAFTLYALIVNNIDHSIMEDLYYKKYLAFIWIPTLLIPLFCLAERNKRMDEGICKMTSPRTVIFRVCNLLLPLLAQLVLMALVFKKVICVTWAIHNSKHSKVDKTGPLFWLLLRYLGTQLNQMTMWLPIMYWDLLNMLDIPPSPALVYFSAYAPGFTAINGFIVMAGNQPLRSSLYNFFGWARSRFSLISPIQVTFFPPPFHSSPFFSPPLSLPPHSSHYRYKKCIFNAQSDFWLQI
eukprot:Phypoly_transcript_08209.p1 GENE.Phypoly_transcript_08209~~Phypoly_transcript_08209.p1  ORF type:complete len:249 (+),score=23.49 Phypoly_transcript_08209:263-1009(+)